MAPEVEKFLQESTIALTSRTPLTDKFVADMESMIVPVELRSHPRIVDQIRHIMQEWAEFARSLEELSNALREHMEDANGKETHAGRATYGDGQGIG